MLAGILVFLFLAAAGIAGEILLVDRLRNHSRINDWLADHVYLPALRMPALIGFVLASYPALYGIETGPPLRVLLDVDWFGQALNLLFILPLLISLLPFAHHLTALVLPLQAMAVTALLFVPLAAFNGTASPRFAFDAATWLALLVFGAGGHVLGRLLAERLPRRNFVVPIYDAVILLCQAPAVLAYGRALGARL